MTDSDEINANEFLKPVSFGRPKVYIEYWTNWETHQWCTNHKSEKYINYLAKVKEEILNWIPDCIIIENDLPDEKSGSLIKMYNKANNEYIIKYRSKKGERSNFPRVGAFEVYFKERTIFSKLKSSLWPHPEKLAK